MPTGFPDLKTLKAMLKQHLHDQWGDTKTCELELFAHGEANVIFRLNGSELVRVAVNTPNQRFGGNFSRITQFEQAILIYLKGTGIGHELHQAVPEPIGEFPYTYLITNYLEGRSLNYGRSHLQKAAETLATLHRLSLSPDYDIERLIPPVQTIEQPLTLFYHESKRYAQPYLESPDADPDIVEMLQSVLSKAKARMRHEHLLADYPHMCLVHSDHTFENWVINDHSAYLVDWEWAEIGSPAGDLGHFLSPVTIHRYHGYSLPVGDRAFFLDCYYNALENQPLATAIKHHFSAFGVYPAVRSFCWTAGYWITANLWYAHEDSPNAVDRMARLQRTRAEFALIWQDVMAWLEEDV